jgi:hypothetical protein
MGSSPVVRRFPGREYTLQLLAHHLIHAWDLARTISADERLDAGLVESCATWFEAMEDAYCGASAIAARPPVPGDADAQTLLLACFGRRALEFMADAVTTGSQRQRVDLERAELMIELRLPGLLAVFAEPSGEFAGPADRAQPAFGLLPYRGGDDNEQAIPCPQRGGG